MVLTFQSTVPEVFKIIGQDSEGSRRVAVATRVPGAQTRWALELTHPSGRNWKGDFFGPNVLDALSELVRSKDDEYKSERARGHRPPPEPFGISRHVSVPDDGHVTPITPRR
jgi:hypothetical protein